MSDETSRRESSASTRSTELEAREQADSKDAELLHEDHDPWVPWASSSDRCWDLFRQRRALRDADANRPVAVLSG